MPSYSYHCSNCNNDFELFFYIKDYDSQPKCVECASKKTHRNYVADVLTQSATVKKSDSELKTIGDLALRNTERMSDDQKSALYRKHNEYKEDTSADQKPLPTGMSRLKKPPKQLWPGSTGKKRRKPKNETR
jgi:putative FmdB family regulatory protein